MATRIGVIGPTLGKPGRSLEAYQKVLTMMEAAQRVSVVTSLRQYEDMVIESMEVPRNIRSIQRKFKKHGVVYPSIDLSRGEADFSAKVIRVVAQYTAPFDFQTATFV